MKPVLVAHFDDRVANLGRFSTRKVTEYIEHGHNSALWSELTRLCQTFYANSTLWYVEILGDAGQLHEVIEFYRP